MNGGYLDRCREAVPARLRELPVWLLWRSLPGDKKRRKVPYYASGTPRCGSLDSPADRSELVAFDEAAVAFALGTFAGLGIALGEVPGEEVTLAGIDLDNLGERPEAEPRAAEILAAAESYAERSPSGRGLHILGTVRAAVTVKRPQLEVYSAARYFTVTGEPLNGALLADISAAIDVARRVFEAPEADEPEIGAGSRIGEGDRHNATVTRAAQLRRSGLSGAELLAALVAWNSANCSPPSPAEEVEAIAAHADTRAQQLAEADRTDIALAERFATQHAARLRYCANWARWLVWSGANWRNDETGEAARCAQETARGIFAEAAQAAQADHQRDLAKLAIRASSAQGQRAILELARFDMRLVVTSDALDREPWLLNCANGTLNLRTGSLRAHERGDLLTKLAPVGFDPGAPCTRWLAFLGRVLAQRADLIAFLQRAVGYMLTGETSEQCFFFLFGTGANGKSTFLSTLAAMLGDYACRISADALMVTRDAIPRDLARLPGVRLAIASELEAGQRLHEARVKDLTGGDRIAARLLYSEAFEFTPACKLVLYGNHRPTIRGADHGMWRRVRLVPFTERISKAERDEGLNAKLLAELPGILAWAVDGCRAWQQERLGSAQAVSEATAEYQAEQDVLGAFLAERCVVRADYSEPAKALYDAYTSWALSGNERAMTLTAFGRALEERGFAKGKRSGSRERLGLRLCLSDDV